jgi:hypothetical protein
MQPPLQLASQDGRIEFGHVLEEELVHPEFRHWRGFVPQGADAIEEKDVPRHAMPPGALSQLQHPMIGA